MSDAENAPHLGEHEHVLLHVRAAQALGQAGRPGLRAHEFVGALRTVAHRQFGVRIQLAGSSGTRDQFGDGNLAERFARPRGLAHVALDQAAVGTAHLRNRLARREMCNRVDIHAGSTAVPSAGPEGAA